MAYMSVIDLFSGERDVEDYESSLTRIPARLRRLRVNAKTARRPDEPKHELNSDISNLNWLLHFPSAHSLHGTSSCILRI